MVEECTINVGFHSDSALVVGMNFGSPASTCASSRISVQPNLRAVGARCPSYRDILRAVRNCVFCRSDLLPDLMVLRKSY